MSKRRELGLLLAVFGLGCTVHVDPYGFPSRSFGYGISPAPPAAHVVQPDLAIADAEVEARLARRGERDAAREDWARSTLEARHGVGDVQLSVAGAAAVAARAYRLGAPAAAAEALAAHPAVFRWDQADAWAEISTVYGARGSGGGVLELTVTRRPGVEGAFAVAFPPGAFAQPVQRTPLELAAGGSSELAPAAGEWTRPEQDQRYGRWPPAQDLALLSAPVLVVPEGIEFVVAELPIACASFERGGPVDGQPFTLSRFPAGSAMERLLVEVCAGAAVDDAEIQLAVWLCRNDISWAAFVAEGGAFGRLGTFGSGQSVRPGDAAGAARILLDAGVDPRPLRFFGGAGAPAPGDAEPAPAAPAPPPPAEPADLS